MGTFHKMQTSAHNVIPLAFDVTSFLREYELVWGCVRQQLLTKYEAFVPSQTNIALKQTFDNGEKTDRSDTSSYQRHPGSRQMLRAFAGISSAAMEQGMNSIASHPFRPLTVISFSQDHQFQHRFSLSSLMR